MTKKFKIASSRTHFALSELPDPEIAALLEDVETEPLTLFSEDGSLPPLGDITQKESELFTKIVTGIAGESMPYGQAVILLAIYAITVEDRVRTALLN